MVILYADENVRAVYRPAESPVLLVTFNPAGFPAQSPGFWGEQFADTLGCAALGFVSATINWFPAVSMCAAAAAVAPVRAGFAEVITFGFSLGGYGALKYGRLLGADLAIAFSPPSPTVRAATPFTLESRNPGAYVGLDVGPADVAPRAFLVHDPLNAVDRRSVQVVVEGGAACVPVPTYGGGHLCIRPGMAHFGALVDACRADDRARLFALLARRRRDVRRRPVILASRAAQRRPALAEAIYRRHADRFAPAEAAELHIALARAWAGTGAPGAALLAAGRAHALLDDAAEFADARVRPRAEKARAALDALHGTEGWPERWSGADAPAADLMDQPLAV